MALAVGVQIQYFDARLSRRALGPLGISTLKGDDVGFGLTAGIRLTPLPGTVIGLGYRSGVDHELDWTLNTANAGTFDVDYDGVDLPDIVTPRHPPADHRPAVRHGRSGVVELEPFRYRRDPGWPRAGRSGVRL